MRATEIKKDIFWVGAVDWNIRDFHGYSTPAGTTYNAYLALDDKIALIDTVKKSHLAELVRRVGEVVDPSRIDYLIVNHVELDHSGALPEIMELVNPEKLFCSANGKKALLAHFGREDWPYEVVGSVDSIDLGRRSMSFIETRMLHWPDSMFSYFPEEGLLISQDAFGQHWATSERFDDEVDASELMRQAAKYYANILMPYSPLVQKLLGEVASSGLRLDMIAPDHGLIWRADPGAVTSAYDRWSRHEVADKAVVVYDTMWQSTELMAKAVGDGLVSEGVHVKVMNLQVSHRSDVITELLDSRAVVFGSPTLNNGLLPGMADLLCYMKGLRPTGKIGAAFGSYGWGGEAVKLLNAAMEDMKFDVVDEGVRVNYVPNAEALGKCEELGRKVGAAIKAR